HLPAPAVHIDGKEHRDCDQSKRYKAKMVGKVLQPLPGKRRKADGEQNEKPQCQPPKPDLFLFQVARLSLMPGLLVLVWHKFRPVPCGRGKSSGFHPCSRIVGHWEGPYNATRVRKLVRWSMAEMVARQLRLGHPSQRIREPGSNVDNALP